MRRLIASLLLSLLFCTGAAGGNAYGTLTIYLQFSDISQGKILPIPFTNPPGTCSAGVNFFGFSDNSGGFAEGGGIYIRPQTAVTDGANVTYTAWDCNSNILAEARWVITPYPRPPSYRFHIKTKAAVLGVRG